MKSLLLLLALAVGGAFPGLARCAPGLGWLVMAMLFIACIDMHLPWREACIWPLRIVVGSQALAWLLWLLAMSVHSEWALAAFLLAATPTATAAPTIMLLSGRGADRVCAAVLCGNVVTALILACELPALGLPATVADILLPVAHILAPPVLLAVLLRWCWPWGATVAKRLRSAALSVWLLALVLIAARSSALVHAGVLNMSDIVPAMGIAMIVCAASFTGGYLIGGVESAQAMGQKNTVLCAWMATQWCSPMVALVPICYALVHNSVNAWILRGPACVESKPLEVSVLGR